MQEPSRRFLGKQTNNAALQRAALKKSKKSDYLEQISIEST